MTGEPTVSVLMTAYNRERYIGMAIESVLASTFSDFELIIVDDCSTDGTLEIARDYSRQDGRVRVEVNESNLGDYPNRNCAASLARGKWLKYVDADDYIYPHGLEVLISTMARFPEAAYGLCSFPELHEQPFPICLSPREAYRRHYFETSLFHRAPLSSIIAKTAWEAVGGFSNERMTSDMDMWHRLSRQFSVVLMEGGLVWYRVHDAQESAIMAPKAHFWGLRYQAITERAILDPVVPLTSAERVEIARSLRRQNLKSAIHLMAKGQINNARAYLSMASELHRSFAAYRQAGADGG
jgi:cellulose synthase/poly-beta-1,6-N-acetylglucosamine synthase-like glycosyltransferase